MSPKPKSSASKKKTVSESQPPAYTEVEQQQQQQQQQQTGISSSSSAMSSSALPPYETSPSAPSIVITCDCCESKQSTKYCATCIEFKSICDDCFDILHKALSKKSHIPVPWNPSLIRIHKPSTCDTHPEETRDFYCMPCQLLICKHCLTSASHRGHETQLADDLNLIASVKSNVAEKVTSLSKLICDIANFESQVDREYFKMMGSRMS